MAIPANLFMGKTREFDNPKNAVRFLRTIYGQVQENANKAVTALEQSANPADIDFNLLYPMIGFDIPETNPNIPPAAAFGFCREVAKRSGAHVATITRPDIFGKYLESMIGSVMEAHGVKAIVGSSRLEVPPEYIPGVGVINSEFRPYFPPQNMRVIRESNRHPDGSYPLAFFSGLETDLSLDRLLHYTGTDPSEFCPVIFCVNYNMFLQAFLKMYEGDDDVEIVQSFEGNSDGKHGPQMPAVHVKRKRKPSISMVNIGVGPSNASNFARHVAVLRPELVMMLGHCAGLRETQNTDRYILADNYYRDDKVSHIWVAPNIAIPHGTELNQAIRMALRKIRNLKGDELRPHLESGTVITTHERNWELIADLCDLYADDHDRMWEPGGINALAVDMESGTLAAVCYRFATPFATLLRITDRPAHADPKGAESAQTFYDASIEEHIRVAIRAADSALVHPERLHSRKFRSNVSPAWR